MAEQIPQTFANHTRWDPLFHFFALPVFLLSVIGAIVLVVRHPHLHPIWLLVVCIAAVVTALKIRLYSLKVQDRVIRLEERLRLATVLPESLRSRIGELSEEQLVGLRFASDAELPGLVEKTLAEKLSRTDIKKSIRTWRPDYWRV